MTKNDFLGFLHAGDFKQLFLECGWNNPTTTDAYPIPVGEETYSMSEVAQKGLKIYVCKVAKMPELAYDALNGLVKGRTKMNIELTAFEGILNRLNETTRNIILAVFSCVLFIGSCILSSADLKPLTPSGQPLIAAGGMVFSIALGIYTIKRMSKKK